MAMAGVGLAGVSLSEAYAMRALNKEKMKKQKAAENPGLVADNEKNIPKGCSFWVSKKSHSAKVLSADVDPKLQVEDKGDSKS